MVQSGSPKAYCPRLPEKGLVNGDFSSYAQDILLGPTIFFAKLSILFLYLKIFQVDRSTKYAIYTGMLFDFLIYWPNIGLNSYFCAPKPGEPWGLAALATCSKTTVWGVIQGSLAVVLDIYLFILPMPVLARLHLKRSKKVGVMAVFGTAALYVPWKQLLRTSRLVSKLMCRH